MTTYTIFNIVILALLLPLSWIVLPKSARMSGTRMAAKNATLLVIVAYPWDFFAGHLGVWRYPENPGFTLYGVPLNDLILVWVCTHFSCCVLYVVIKRQDGRKSHPKRENTDE